MESSSMSSATIKENMFPYYLKCFFYLSTVS